MADLFEIVHPYQAHHAVVDSEGPVPETTIVQTAVVHRLRFGSNPELVGLLVHVRVHVMLSMIDGRAKTWRYVAPPETMEELILAHLHDPDAHWDIVP